MNTRQVSIGWLNIVLLSVIIADAPLPAVVVDMSSTFDPVESPSEIKCICHSGGSS